MLKTIPILIALSVLSSPAVHAEIVDESWRQVYDFQSKMAAQGNNKAQFTLGEMYENGRGVEQDYDAALEWYSKAQENGHTGAAAQIANVHRSIRQAEKDAQKDVQKAEAKRKADEERAQQKDLEKKRAAEAKRKKEARDKKSAAKVRKAAKKKKTAQAKLTPEERAKKIKAAQERAKKIALANEKKQQQEANAALKKYRSAMSAKADTGKKEPKSKIPNKYVDPFE